MENLLQTMESCVATPPRQYRCVILMGMVTLLHNYWHGFSSEKKTLSEKQMQRNESIIRKYEKVLSELIESVFCLPSSIFLSRMLHLINLVMRLTSPGLIILLKLVLLYVIAFNSKHFFCYSIGTGVQLKGVMDLLVYLGKLYIMLFTRKIGHLFVNREI